MPPDRKEIKRRLNGSIQRYSQGRNVAVTSRYIASIFKLGISGSVNSFRLIHRELLSRVWLRHPIVGKTPFGWRVETATLLSKNPTIKTNII
jgi:hypothetical protein